MSCVATCTAAVGIPTVVHVEYRFTAGAIFGGAANRCVRRFVVRRHRTYFDRVSRPPRIRKSTYDASRNEAPAEAETRRSPESAELSAELLQPRSDPRA